MSKFELNLVYSSARHTGGTKHYAVAALTIETDVKSHSIGRVLRAYGGLGSASRKASDGFKSAAQARNEYDNLRIKKAKGGYTALDKSSSVMVRVKFDTMKQLLKIIDEADGELYVALRQKGFTQNTHLESIEDVYESELKEIRKTLIDFVESALKGNSTYEQTPDDELIAKKREAQLAAAAALESKRLETYGDTWGSW